MIDWEEVRSLVVGFVLAVLVLWCALLTVWQTQDERDLERLWRLYEGERHGQEAGTP